MLFMTANEAKAIAKQIKKITIYHYKSSLPSNDKWSVSLTLSNDTVEIENAYASLQAVFDEISDIPFGSRVKVQHVG